MAYRRLFPLLFILFCAGCAPVDALNSLVPTNGYRVEKNIPYGAAPRQSLDLYLPSKITNHTPVVVFFYGGSWQFGNKDNYLFVGQGLASLGYIVAIPDYRLYPSVQYPAFLQDSASAVAWVYNHAGDYGGNSENLYLIGHSAGAYNAMMLALNPSYMEQAGGKTGWLRGVAGLAGPYDFLPFTDPKIIDIFSTEPDAPKTQPIHYAHPRAPRMLLLTGNDDDTVSPGNSKRLSDRLTSFGNDVTLKDYDGVGHYGIALGLATPIMWNAQVREDIRVFISGGD